MKPDGHGVDLERKTVDLINAYDMRDQVAVASISYESLAKVKEIDPSMPTMYDMTLAYGSISSICLLYTSCRHALHQRRRALADERLVQPLDALLDAECR